MRWYAVIFLLTQSAVLAQQEKGDFEKFFTDHNVQGCFVCLDAGQNRYIRYNPERCRQAFLPASTFKILNSLIGLETGVIADENYLIPWDGVERSIAPWNQDHTLKSAMKHSVVWYYQELARRVGAERMSAYVKKSHYGNEDISDKIDTFWLEGALRISPDEQVGFLRRFYEFQLPFSRRSVEIVKSILLQEENERYRLYAKTGWAVRTDRQIGWFVGFVERDRSVYYFATNIESSCKEALFGPARIEISKAILRDLNILD